MSAVVRIVMSTVGIIAMIFTFFFLKDISHKLDHPTVQQPPRVLVDDGDVYILQQCEQSQVEAIALDYARRHPDDDFNVYDASSKPAMKLAVGIAGRTPQWTMYAVKKFHIKQ